MPFPISRRSLLVASISAVTVNWVCSPTWAQTPPASGSDAVWNYLNEMPAGERLAFLKNAAEQEGQLVIYGALGIDRATIFIEAFKKRYPNVKVDFVRLRESELVERVNLEVNAGRPGGDLIISNVPWLGLLQNSIAGYIPTTWDQFKPNYRFGSAEEGWSAVAYEALPAAITWRTDRIPADAAPKSLEDLTDPKYMNRLGTTSHLESLIDGLQVALGEEKANALVDKLAQQNNKLYPSMAGLSDGLSSGEIDVAWNIGGHRPVKLLSKGAPVDFVLQDPLLALGITVSAVKGAPNSYAAALMMEFMTEPSTLEALDKSEGGRIFGIKGGNFSIDPATLPDVTFYRSISEERFAELSAIAEEKFLRR